MAAPPPSVIVVVDDDAALCELLQALLTGPGRVVDTVVGLAGLTPELLALSQPRLVLLNPRMGQLPLEELRRVVLEVRELTQARFILMVGEEDRQADLPARLGADREVDLEVLLRDPLKELALQGGALLDLAPAAPAAGPGLSALTADQILATELDDGPPASRPSRVQRARALVRQSAVFAQLSALIDEELQEAERPSQVVQQYAVTLDTFSDDNLVVGADRGLDGVFVSTLFPPRLGARVLLRVAFPWGAEVEVEGAASWQRAENFRRLKAGVGVTVAATPAFRAEADRFLGLRQPLRRP